LEKGSRRVLNPIEAIWVSPALRLIVQRPWGAQLVVSIPNHDALFTTQVWFASVLVALPLVCKHPQVAPAACARGLRPWDSGPPTGRHQQRDQNEGRGASV